MNKQIAKKWIEDHGGIAEQAAALDAGYECHEIMIDLGQRLHYKTIEAATAWFNKRPRKISRKLATAFFMMGADKSHDDRAKENAE